MAVANQLALRAIERRIEALAGQRSSPELPCAALPTRFVATEPVCAQKLIEAMNVTKVRIRLLGASDVWVDRPTLPDLRNESGADDATHSQ